MATNNTDNARFIGLLTKEESILANLHDEIMSEYLYFKIIKPQDIQNDEGHLPSLIITDNSDFLGEISLTSIPLWFLGSSFSNNWTTFENFEQLVQKIHEKLSFQSEPLRLAPYGGFDIDGQKAQHCYPLELMWWNYPNAVKLNRNNIAIVKRFLKKHNLDYALRQSPFGCTIAKN